MHQKQLVLHYSLGMDVCQGNYPKTKFLAVHGRNRTHVIYKELKEGSVNLGGDVSWLFAVRVWLIRSFLFTTSEYGEERPLHPKITSTLLSEEIPPWSWRRAATPKLQALKDFSFLSFMDSVQ